MDSKMLKSQEQSQQLQDEKLEAIAGGVNNLVKNISLPGKVVRWAAVAASVVGMSIGMAMPAQAINRTECRSDDLLRIAQGPVGDRATMCFANAGSRYVLIADVHRIASGNNAGWVDTNKGRFHFGKNQQLNFINGDVGSTVTITAIWID